MMNVELNPMMTRRLFHDADSRTAPHSVFHTKRYCCQSSHSQFSVAHFSFLILFAFAALLGSTASAQDDSLVLPPPPSAELPAVDLTMLAAMRGAPAAIASVPDETLPATPAMPVMLPGDGSRQVAAAVPVLDGILKDVGHAASGRQMLETMLFDQLRQALPGSEDFLLEQATIPDSVHPPAGAWTVRYDFRLPSRGLGRASYNAVLRETATGATQRFSGTVGIDREASGLSVTRLVRRGEILGPDDVQTLSVRLSQLPRGALDQPELAVGAKAVKELRPGEWLTDQAVSMPALVKRGQGVTMRLVHGPLEITAPGIVMQSGGRGQVVRVQNVSSKKEIFARIISKDEVQVIN